MPERRDAITPDPTVFITDDEVLHLEMTRLMLEAEGFPVETFTSARAFLDLYVPGRPGCLVLDLHVPEMSSFQLMAELRARDYGLPVVAMTGYGDIRTAVEAMKAGAVDCLEKPVSREQLVPGVRAAVEKDARLREAAARKAEIEARLASLSPREREVLDHLGQGAANKVIAARLGISVNTAAKHRARILRKMRARNVVELFRLLTSDPARQP